MAGVNVDIELQRNADYVRHFRFRVKDGQSLDLTGAAFTLGVKTNAGLPDPPLAAGAVTFVDAPNGVIRVELQGADFAAVSGEQERVELAYDLIAVQDDVRFLCARGALILLPGVS